MSFFESGWFLYGVLPGLIFLARVVDVTIGTLRVILLSRGHKGLAPLLGFFEVLIWIIVIGKIMQNLDNWVCYIGYAGGFALGNYVGICIEEKLAIGTMLIRIITQKDASALIEKLKARNFGVTRIPAKGAKGAVDVIYIVVKRGNSYDVLEMIEQFNPKAFYSIEDIRFVKEGIFPAPRPFWGVDRLKWLGFYRKGK